MHVTEYDSSVIYRILNSFETRLQSPGSPRLNHSKRGEHQQFQRVANTRMSVSVGRKTKMMAGTKSSHVIHLYQWKFDWLFSVTQSHWCDIYVSHSLTPPLSCL